VDICLAIAFFALKYCTVDVFVGAGLGIGLVLQPTT
jgi:hypothetical protein